MQSIKISITCAKALAAKYDAAAMKRIAKAIKAWVAADAARGIRTLHVAVDDAASMKKLGVPAIAGKATASKIKKAVDALVARLSPDYVVLIGAEDVVPMFEVANPTLDPPDGDTDPMVPTDNPYACSKQFSASRRSSYLIPDRVVGRIPDLKGSNDPSWLVDYLAAATTQKPLPASRYADSLMVCCDSWKKSGEACAKYIARDVARLMICPPIGLAHATMKKRLPALSHMIKCHGAEIDSCFYGQKGRSYPEALSSPFITGRTRMRTVVGAMCCFGASVFDPTDPAATNPNEPPIPSVYLRQGACGFLGSTTTAWVGVQTMLCADWVVASFLKGVLAGSSLGRATLEAKQDFVRWNQQQGEEIDSADEKTLIQFVLLGDPSLHPVAAAAPAGAAVAAAGVRTPASKAIARRQRRATRHQLGELIRDALPERTRVRAGKIPASVQKAARASSKVGRDGFKFHMSKPVVQRVERSIPQPEIAPRAAMAAASRGAPVLARASVERSILQYYWAARRKRGPVPEIRLISVQADRRGNPLRTQVLESC